MAGSVAGPPRVRIYPTIRGTNKGNVVFSPKAKPTAYAF
jgi:hypothetical protein